MQRKAWSGRGLAAMAVAVSAGVGVVVACAGPGSSGHPGPEPAPGVSPRLLRIVPVKAPVVDLAFTRSGQTLAVQLATGVVQLRDPVTGAVRISVRPAARPGTHVSGTMAVSPDGTIIAIGVAARGSAARGSAARGSAARGSAARGSAASAVKLIKVATGELTATIPVRSPAVYSLAFSPDGKTLAVAAGRTLFLLNLATRALIGEATGEGPFAGGSRYVSFSADGRFLAVASTAGLLKLWDVRAASFTKPTTVYSAPGTGGTVVAAMTFSPGGSTIAVSGALKSARNGPAAPQTWLWRPPAGPVRPLQPATVQDGASDENRAQAFSPDGELIATGDDTGVIRLWDTASGTLMATEDAPAGIDPVTSAAFAPDGKWLVTAQSSVSSGSATLQFWDLGPGR